MRRLGLLFLACVLILPVVSAATDPGARDSIPLPGAVNDVDLALTGGRFAAASQDPGAGFGEGQDEKLVWRLWGSGGEILQPGGVDPDGCELSLSNDCTTHATHVALSADGQRLAVGGFVSESYGSLVKFVTSTQGALASAGDDPALDGVLSGLAISDNGNTVAITTTVGQVTPEGRLYYYSWSSGSTIKREWVADLPAPVTGVEVSPDGQMIFVAAGDHHRFDTDNGGIGWVNSVVTGDPLDVSGSATGQHWSLAGYSTGFFALYSDADSNKEGSPHSILKLDEQEALPAVALRRDASALAVGNDQGTVWIYSFDKTSALLERTAKLTGLGAITDLAFSGDGASLAVAADAVRLYRVTKSEASLLWTHEASDALGQVVVDQTGEMVVSAHGDAVTVYDAIHRLTGSGPAAAVQIGPGETKNATVAYTNEGNRYEQATLAGSRAGWTIETGPEVLGLLPGKSTDVEVAVTVPEGQPPGTYKITLDHTLASDPTDVGKTQFDVTVPTVKAWSLDAETATSASAMGGVPAEYTLKLENAGNVEGTTAIQTTGAPTGWSVDTDPAEVTLAAGETASVTISVTPPADAAELARADVKVRLDADASQEVTLTATVGANFGIGLDVPSGVSIEPDSTASFEVRVRNTGNAPDSYQLELGNLPMGWSAAFGNGLASFSFENVEAGGQRAATVSVKAAADAGPNTQVQFTLVGASEADPTQTASRSLLLSVTEPEVVEPPEEGNQTPGLPLVMVLAVALLAARRRH